MSELAIVLIWNIQSPQEDNLSSCERYKVITSKAMGTMHAQHFLITERERSMYDSCRFDIGRFRAEPTNFERCLHPSDTFAYRSAHNNLFLTLRVIHKSKIWSWKPKKLPLETRYERRLMWPIVLCKLLKIMTIHLGDAQTTTCVNLVNLREQALYSRIRRRRQIWEREWERTEIGKRRGWGGSMWTKPSCRHFTHL